MTTRSRTKMLLAAVLMASSAAAAGAITDVRFQNTGAAQSSVPVTFGQVFAVGDMKKTDVLVGKLDGAAVPLQVDVKATHADGSVRHAIISAIVPKLAAGATGTMTLSTGGTVVQSSGNPGQLTDAGFTASTSATIAGVKYSASADQLLKGTTSTWLSGAVANEWQVSAPLTTAAGVAHPHLQARFAIRYYSAVKKARVDVTIENDWAYEPGPQNFTYDADVTVGGKQVYAKAALVHLHHARWRKVFWWGDAPAVNVQSNVPYLISTRAVPNYDQSIKMSEGALTGMAISVEPMGIGLAVSYMPMTGAHADIGILPQWTAAYLLTMDSRARAGTMATADGAGSWSTHYRDRVTDRPVSLKNYPYMTIVGRETDTGNPVTNKLEAFPYFAADYSTPYTHDIPHQPSLAYLPYLLTGDYYYLEELQFWAMYDTFASNPNYRNFGAGLVIPEQIRGQAWALRTLAHATYITPDADPLKSDFTTMLDNNLNWYNAEYPANASANSLGVILNGFAIGYNGNTALAPWQDDFFTQSIGNAVDLGFEKARPLLVWKSKFPISRMTDSGACWIDAATYALTVRNAETSPLFTTYAEAYRATHTAEIDAMTCGGAAMQANFSVGPGEMTGYAFGNTGYPSNMQPAMAYAADYAGDAGKAAWAVFDARKVKPNYQDGPQFAIVPRTVASAAFVPPTTDPASPAAPTAPAVPAVPATMSVVSAPTAAGTWSKIGMEHSTITVAADTIVRYGDAGKYAYAKISGTFTAENDFFGGDPAPTITKTVEAFSPSAAPVAKPGKVTTPTNVKLVKLTGLIVTFVNPLTLAEVKEFAGITATTKGAITVTDTALAPGDTYFVRVADASGKVLDILYPITAL
jgi:hypothetical protein